MKKLLLPILFALLLPMTYSCSSSLFGRYTLTETDAASAIKQLLEIVARESLQSGTFNKETIMASVFPESIRKTLNTLNQLGLTNEINRFTTTLGTAAEKSAERSIPIFVSGIGNMRLVDAMQIVKNGGTAGTDYLRLTIGDSLRRAIDPIMEQALQEYNLNFYGLRNCFCWQRKFFLQEQLLRYYCFARRIVGTEPFHSALSRPGIVPDQQYPV